MAATASPAISPFPVAASSADSWAYAFCGPARQARRASWRSWSGSDARTRWATRLRATTSPFSSTARAFTEVVPMSTPTVIDPRRLLTDPRFVS